MESVEIPLLIVFPLVATAWAFVSRELLTMLAESVLMGVLTAAGYVVALDRPSRGRPVGGTFPLLAIIALAVAIGAWFPLLGEAL